jgi:hypothetical protein
LWKMRAGGFYSQNSLCNKMTRKEIKKALKEMNVPAHIPYMITALYDEDMIFRIGAIDDYRRKIALKILSVVYVAERSLGLNELQHALVTDPRDKDLTHILELQHIRASLLH